MTKWVPDLSPHAGPRYQALAGAIAEAVQSGELPPGAKLPPQRQMAWRLGVTVGTVGRAYMLAEQQGLVSGEVGRGTYVRDLMGDLGESEPPVEAGSTVVDNTRNTPAYGPQANAVADALRDIASRPDGRHLIDYAPRQGPARQRAAAARWMARVGLTVEPGRIVLTCGAQQALAACLDGLARPGETVLAEAMTYGGLAQAAALRGLRLHPVALDEHGMEPDALVEAHRATGARVVALVPSFQNPTTAMMPEWRRQEIAEAARAHDLIVIEDDVYGYLADDRPPTIASLAPERTVYVTSVSKCLLPGLRVGWAACPPALCEAVAEAAHAMSVAQPALTGEVVAAWVEQGVADRLVDWQMREIEARHAIANEILTGIEFRGEPRCLHIFAALPPPWRAEAFAAAAREQGVVLTTAADFAVDGVAAPEAVRICLGAPASRDALRRLLATVGELAAEPPGGRSYVI